MKTQKNETGNLIKGLHVNTAITKVKRNHWREHQIEKHICFTDTKRLPDLIDSKFANIISPIQSIRNL
ncbi:MAG: hypothetical protein ACFFAJ_01820 [Candidatus Hodarchaeota archaeon]